MEKKGRVLFIVVIAMIGIIGYGMTARNNRPAANDYRLRIIANSDSELDQSHKILVKETLEQLLETVDMKDAEQVRNGLIQSIDQPFIQNVSVEWVSSQYPAKSYNGKFLPSGAYPTLLVTLGEGKGHNWWTILYPEFFAISFEDSHEVEYRSYLYDLFTGKKQ